MAEVSMKFNSGYSGIIESNNLGWASGTPDLQVFMQVGIRNVGNVGINMYTMRPSIKTKIKRETEVRPILSDSSRKFHFPFKILIPFYL